jgi:hypothetical protein
MDLAMFLRHYQTMRLRRTFINIAFPMIGWVLCGITMELGRHYTSLNNALIIHGVAAPVFFSLLSLVYFSKIPSAIPLRSAILFTGIVVILDASVVAPLIEKSYDMFRSILGTWLPFFLIFLSTLITGKLIRR